MPLPSVRMAEELVEVRIKKSGSIPPTAANWFNFSFQGPEVQMMIGYVDLHDLVMTGAPGGPKRARVDAEVLHRVMLSSKGFAMLRQQIQEIGMQFDKMVAEARQAAEQRMLEQRSGQE